MIKPDAAVSRYDQQGVIHKLIIRCTYINKGQLMNVDRCPYPYKPETHTDKEREPIVHR